MLSLPHLLPPPLVLSLSLLTISFAPPFICLLFSVSSVFLSLPLALSLCLLFSALFTALLSLCACSPPLFSSVTSHPLFSLCRSLFPFPFSLFAALFSFTLGVSALWKLSNQWDIQWKKGLKNKLRGRERREVKSSKGLKRRKGQKKGCLQKSL